MQHVACCVERIIGIVAGRLAGIGRHRADEIFMHTHRHLASIVGWSDCSARGRAINLNAVREDFLVGTSFNRVRRRYITSNTNMRINLRLGVVVLQGV